MSPGSVGAGEGLWLPQPMLREPELLVLVPAERLGLPPPSLLILQPLATLGARGLLSSGEPTPFPTNSSLFEARLMDRFLQAYFPQAAQMTLDACLVNGNGNDGDSSLSTLADLHTPSHFVFTLLWKRKCYSHVPGWWGGGWAVKLDGSTLLERPRLEVPGWLSG